MAAALTGTFQIVIFGRHILLIFTLYKFKKMKEVCDKLKQTNLRNDLDDLQYTMRKFENSSVAHNVSHLRERYKLISQMISDAQR